MPRFCAADGNYDGAAAHLRNVLAQYPRDRVALNDLGRILFLQRKYADAVKSPAVVLAIDPEDLQAHYNLMLCYNGLGDEKLAKEHEERYLRFKADEAVAGDHRAVPADQSRRQQRAAVRHEHVSVPLPRSLEPFAGEAPDSQCASTSAEPSWLPLCSAGAPK